MNDTYAVINKSKQPPTSASHHYDNTELGGIRGSAAPAPAVSDLYSIVKPKGRPGARSPVPHPMPIYDTAGVGKQRAGEPPVALAKDHGDYELMPGERGRRENRTHSFIMG